MGDDLAHRQPHAARRRAINTTARPPTADPPCAVPAISLPPSSPASPPRPRRCCSTSTPRWNTPPPSPGARLIPRPARAASTSSPPPGPGDRTIAAACRRAADYRHADACRLHHIAAHYQRWAPRVTTGPSARRRASRSEEGTRASPRSGSPAADRPNDPLPAAFAHLPQRIVAGSASLPSPSSEGPSSVFCVHVTRRSSLHPQSHCCAAATAFTFCGDPTWPSPSARSAELRRQLLEVIAPALRRASSRPGEDRGRILPTSASGRPIILRFRHRGLRRPVHRRHQLVRLPPGQRPQLLPLAGFPGSWDLHFRVPQEPVHHPACPPPPAPPSAPCAALPSVLVPRSPQRRPQVPPPPPRRPRPCRAAGQGTQRPATGRPRPVSTEMEFP